jgi:MFS family permease
LLYFSEKDLSITRTKNEINMYTIKCAECGCYPEDWIVLLSANSFIGIIVGMSFLGIGTALVYPTLLAAISDVASPKWRATSLGVYRFWRDLGFVFGAIGVGFIADLSSNSIAIQLVAWIATASGIFVLFIMKETRKV